MQRIALTLLAVSTFVIIGCPPPSQRDVVPLPDPLTSTGHRTPPTQVMPSPPPQPVSSESIGGVAVRQLAPNSGIQRGRWQTIVVHHSATDKDTPQGMDAWHRQRGWDGLGYDFVIGNGVNYPDGKLYVGHRWTEQLVGAHTRAGAGVYFGIPRPANFFNERGIGICLIGNFEESRPTPRQMQTLQLLIQWLGSQTGISTARVYGHGEVTHKTQCPGRYLRPELAQIRRNGVRVVNFGAFEAQELAGQMDLAGTDAPVNAADLLALVDVRAEAVDVSLEDGLEVAGDFAAITDGSGNADNAIIVAHPVELAENAPSQSN